uniref:Molybdate-anion transporter n=1 Tax=Geotrypetes seraphini TaxID=260995 RepID=A0A6P8R982_GEOSA|nr:molybdate-anion transporter [Geotrypetes seraphini]XP_033795524.1 molybdate-anion transporter [Geotrypetes seraphini]XP_033795526.1 molybdate-anion transporter [Geotrypetes seraphini]XP_033795527.1 molybdate-anion transporter [Geotrypetes seraphini]
MLIAAYISFLILLALCLGLELSACRSKLSGSSCTNPAFLKFQLSYYQVYFLALAADWLQGPYLYKLYLHYQFLESQIAIIYVCGFASSVLFGLVSTSLADRLGRKKTCILFSLTYSVCCLTKLSRDYFVLIVGRILGGLSTALLFFAFEAWYIHEHVERLDFPPEWIGATFSRAAFWNGVIAIGAGVVANFFAEWLMLGPVAPFMVSIPFLVLTGVFIMKNWDENFGKKNNFSRTCVEGLRCLLSDRRVLLLGTIQALFESVIYIFIFLWTPVLDPHQPPLGIVFSSFMAASMLGSSLYRIATSKKYHLQPIHILSLSVLMLFFSLFMLTFSTHPSQENPSESFLAFLLIELACGLYFPAMGFLRQKVIPEKDQVGVLNWFRVPLNLLACLGMLILHDSDYKTGTRNMFSICAVMMVMALLAVVSLFSLVRNDAELKMPPPGQSQQLPSTPEL